MAIERPQLPLLEEFSFPSKIPVVGPLISFIRRLLYGLTARWAVWFLIQQQNQINQIIEDRLRQQEALLIDINRNLASIKSGDIPNLAKLLIDIDRNLALLARTVAEIEICQRYLMKKLEANCTADQIQRDT